MYLNSYCFNSIARFPSASSPITKDVHLKAIFKIFNVKKFT